MAKVFSSETAMWTATEAVQIHGVWCFSALVSLCPVVSKAPDVAILVRNSRRLILLGYSEQKIRTFRIPHGGAEATEIQTHH